MDVELPDYGLSMAGAVADSVNLYLQKLYQIRTTTPGEFAGEEFGVAVIGYGGDGASPAKLILYMDASETKADGKATRRDEATISSDATHPVFPIWIQPAAEGSAALCAGISLANDIAASWITNHGSVEPPHIINITDGSMSDGDPIGIAEKVQGLSTSRGKVNLWTCHFTSSHSPVILFPSEDALAAAPPNWRALLRSSSPLPQGSIRDIMLEFPEVSKIAGSRCCIFNADLAFLVRAIACITRLPLP